MSTKSSTAGWALWATHPRHLDCIAELYATPAEAGLRASQLREAGYSVEIVLSNMTSTSSPIGPFDGDGSRPQQS